jgi:hypothetical protein
MGQSAFRDQISSEPIPALTLFCWPDLALAHYQPRRDPASKQQLSRNVF